MLFFFFGVAAAAVATSTPTATAVAAATARAPNWQVKNNTNLKYGDLTKLDFKLPINTSDAQGIEGCTSFCAKHSACEAWVFVRDEHRCAIKGYNTGWCEATAPYPNCIAGIRQGITNITSCSQPPPSPAPSPGLWRLPAINWTAGGVVGPTDNYAVRAFDVVYWQPEGKWYAPPFPIPFPSFPLHCRCCWV